MPRVTELTELGERAKKKGDIQKSLSFSKSVSFSEFTLQFDITQNSKANSSQFPVLKFHTSKIPNPFYTQTWNCFHLILYTP